LQYIIECIATRSTHNFTETAETTVSSPEKEHIKIFNRKPEHINLLFTQCKLHESKFANVNYTKKKSVEVHYRGHRRIFVVE